MFNLLVGLYLILGIIIGILVVLIILYIIMSKSKIKAHLKKEEQYIENKDKVLSKEYTEDLVLSLGQEMKYKGTFKSLSSKTQKKALRYVKEFVFEVAPYVLIKENVDSKKYRKVYIAFNKHEDSKLPNKKHFWFFNPKKNVKSNYKSLVKVTNKHKCAKSLVETLTKIYIHVKDKTTFPETPTSMENGYYIYFIMK